MLGGGQDSRLVVDQDVAVSGKPGSQFVEVVLFVGIEHYLIDRISQTSPGNLG